MARTTIKFNKARNVFQGEFEPIGGWKRGKRGILRTLCNLTDIEHLSDELQAKELKKLYDLKLWEYKNQQLIDEQIEAERKRDLNKMNFASAAQIWLDDVEKTKSKRTADAYQKTIYYYLQSQNDHKLKDFNRENNVKFYDFLAKKAEYRGKKLSATTQNYHMRQLAVFLKWAYDNEILPKQINLIKAKKPKKDMETFSIDHLKTLRDFIDNRLVKETSPREILNLCNMRRAFVMATNSLLRIGPIRSMRLDWIDLDALLIRVQDNPDLDFKNKANKQPNKPINTKLAEFLCKDLVNRGPKEVYFLDNGFGQPWYADKAGPSKYASKVCALAGLPKLKPFHHGMRATMITWLLNNGVDVHVVKELADHDDIKTTLLYLNARTVDQQTAVDALPDF